jgi:hypothetical protein
MARLAGRGFAVELPPRFEGRIFQRNAVAGAETFPILQVATFPIPAHAADFGGAATPLMSDGDIFVVVADYGPSSLGRALFARQGMPRQLSENDFHPYLLRRGIRKQAGTQWFFTEAGRPCTLYAVLGSYQARQRLVPEINQLLAGLAISELVEP